jgi:taurine dioxygenase
MDNVTALFVARRMAGTIGADIGGIKLRPDLPDAVIAELRRLWLEHLVLFFRKQELTPQGLAAVAGASARSCTTPSSRASTKHRR